MHWEIVGYDAVYGVFVSPGWIASFFACNTDASVRKLSYNILIVVYLLLFIVILYLYKEFLGNCLHDCNTTDIELVTLLFV